MAKRRKNFNKAEEKKEKKKRKKKRKKSLLVLPFLDDPPGLFDLRFFFSLIASLLYPKIFLFSKVFFLGLRKTEICGAAIASARSVG
jgi:hypothetical protein